MSKLKNLDNKNILITGANGCIGYELVRKLINTNNRLLLLDRAFDNLIRFKDRDNIKLLKLDITDQEELFNIDKEIDIIIHLAAKVHTKPKNKEEVYEFYLINTQGTKNLFELGLRKKIEHFIFSSTISVYGPETNEIVDETARVNPQTAYAKSKYQAEEIGLKLYQNKNFPITILRLATIYGNQDRGNYKKLIDFAKRGYLPFIGDGDYCKPIIHVKDVANIMLKIINNSATYGEVYLVSEKNYTYKAIVNNISDVFAINIKKIRIPGALISLFKKLNLNISPINKLITLSNNFNVNNNKIKTELNIDLDYNFKEGLKDSYEYYK
ncbi:MULTISPECIES: NAD-dependent epimerase/dehydratase family protein [unclassified Candidatus Frackibacter]|uniref:NAD-dependent epimerase/dehydratase family protein n=1 Tax=unclassified Candidatus Frackibacter TaxID=2648818 RepID=UPI00088BAF61|nr:MULTISPECIES: NAD(P)-dependent oxidoreductase [unclassified Candidatus Frackibacter]SDC07478.1 Nucleoside-diphosphate-sugar epimerase [Candidatus Frackibacter sp. WG11]SEM38876.1 Nucleoside-diphosphate-sugar epimerase [Candidatus Frackibacter sp. WG12]SFL44585.1 Nucleoside-diphosphate-sugar epimerase [Candidatus Frackibacter sp. WG13]